MERAIGPAKCGWPDPHVSVLLDVFSELKDLLRSYGPIPELFNQGSVSVFFCFLLIFLISYR
uniref:Uncharacterized protein n=1 Tax=Setaria viridis TaxID=4556 RepID=A0A4U6TVR4_SETVI|nr:hypothetical protein SEVIR_7G141750v2 [Setaria viridis]